MRRRMLPVLMLAALPLCGAMPAAMPAMPVPPPERVVLSPNTEAHWVPFELTPGNQIQFRMTVDGHPVTAILDTGFSLSAVSRRFASREGLKITGSRPGVGIGGSVPMGQINGRSLAIGGLTRTGGQLLVLDLPSGATGNGATVDAVIGSDLLQRYALDIDFAAQRFRLLPSGRLPFAGQTAPLSLAFGYQLYVSEMTIDGTRLRPMIVDTGDGATVTMSDEAWKSLAGAKPATTTTISYSIAGPVTSELTVLPAVRVGETMVRDAEARIEPGRGFSAQMGAAGRIGVGYLQRYRVLLDPGAGRMVMAAVGDVDRPPLRSTSGLLVEPDGGRLRVRHVMRGSPAAAAGWQTGDQICSIDGQAITADYANDPISMWSVANPGRVVRLGMCNGGERKLTLERFY